MLIHRMPMRWADLDVLNHVNNVVYVDYATEARAAHEEAGDLEARPVAATSVEFLRPLLLSLKPVVVRSVPDGDTLVQEIGSGEHDTVFARVTTTYGEPARADVTVPDTRPYPLRVRRDDLGPDGAATLVKLFEYAQESRIIALSALARRADPGRFVVARVDMHPAEPITWQPDPIDVHTRVSRVGGSSVTLSSCFAGGRYGTTEAVLVAFDLENQRSRPLTELEREALAAHGG